MNISNQREIDAYSIAVTATNDGRMRRRGVIRNGEIETQVELNPGESREVVLEVKDGIRRAILAHVQNCENIAN